MADKYYSLREALVEKNIKKAVVRAPVSRAFLAVPRHRFVPRIYQKEAYEDRPLPIGCGQTISQPSLVAIIVDLLALKKSDVILEVGTGSGYQAAILSLLCKYVYTIERISSLGVSARRRLQRLGYKNVKVIVGNGTGGLPKIAPFDKITVAASANKIPEPLVSQLKEGGIIVCPVGESEGRQQLVRGVKKRGKLKTKIIEEVRFVPLITG